MSRQNRLPLMKLTSGWDALLTALTLIVIAPFVPGCQREQPPRAGGASEKATAPKLSRVERGKGWHSDDWVESHTAFSVPRPRDGQALIIAGMVPGNLGFRFPFGASVTADGRPVGKQNLTAPGDFRLVFPLPDGQASGNMRVEIEWEQSAKLPPPDGRLIAARLSDAILKDIPEAIRSTGKDDAWQLFTRGIYGDGWMETECAVLLHRKSRDAFIILQGEIPKQVAVSFPVSVSVDLDGQPLGSQKIQKPGPFQVSWGLSPGESKSASIRLVFDQKFRLPRGDDREVAARFVMVSVAPR